MVDDPVIEGRRERMQGVIDAYGYVTLIIPGCSDLAKATAVRIKNGRLLVDYELEGLKAKGVDMTEVNFVPIAS